MSQKPGMILIATTTNLHSTKIRTCATRAMTFIWRIVCANWHDYLVFDMTFCIISRNGLCHIQFLRQMYNRPSRVCEIDGERAHITFKRTLSARRINLVQNNCQWGNSVCCVRQFCKQWRNKPIYHFLLVLSTIRDHFGLSSMKESQRERCEQKKHSMRVKLNWMGMGG